LRKSFFKYKPFLYFLLLAGSYFPVAAQQSGPWLYQYYNTSHGLPSSQITCLAKDNMGFLWVGTSSGLSMFDGYSFKNYAYTNTNELTGHINVIKADAFNRLWIGSGAGLFCRVNNELVKISAATSLPQGVNDILPDTDGSIWLATENGPARLLLTDLDFSGKKKIVLTNYLLKQWKFEDKHIDDKPVTLIAKAGDGTVYIAGPSALFRLINNIPEVVHTIANSRDKIISLFPVSRSTVYFDAVSTEINKVENGILTRYTPLDLYKPGDEDNNPGTWYVGTRGAFYFHPQSGSVSASLKLLDKYLVWATAVLEEAGFFWVASGDGLIRIKPSNFTAYAINEASSYSDFYSLTQLKSGKLLLGANFGKILEKQENSFRLIKDKVVPSAEIKAIYEDDRGWLWIASGYQGLVVVKNGKAESYTIENGLHDNSVYHFIKTSRGQLYVVGDAGMSEIVVTAGNKISFKKFQHKPNTTKYAKFFSGIEAPDGKIWIGGEEGLFYLQNGSLQKFSLNNKQLSINYLLKDKEGKVWVAASGEGILQCAFTKDNKLEIEHRFTETDGLNTLHYLTLLADIKNNIWAGSSAGLSVIGRQQEYKNRISNFDESDGFIKSGYSSITMLEAADNTIWAATTLGVISFNPAQLLSDDAAPAVYITEIKPLKKNHFTTGYPFTEQQSKNEFGYTDNSFNFNFTAIAFENPENTRYYYKLEGLDTNWIFCGKLRSISFENLPPGNYVFRVKALNSKGIWSANDAVYNFTIIPPFWKTWWFVVLLITVAVLCILLFTRYRIKKIRERELVKTALLKLKAANYRDQLEIEKIINYFATSLNSVNNTDDILWDVAKNCISKLDFEDCVIYLLDTKKNTLVQKAAWGPKTTDRNNIINAIEIPVGKGIVGHVALTGRAEIVNDTSLDERYITDDARRMSEIAVPVVIDGSVIGVIDSEHSSKNFYTDRHLQLLTTVASLCAGKFKTIIAEGITREKEIEVLRLHKDFATSQLTALRMQMNPHFIFNALNSVQHYIMQGNVIEANKYLSKFSKLQREILHCSNQQFISLEKETGILNSYLELEQNRLGGTFSYKITMAEEIEPVEILIPPMMLQPFVENAIWHGLMPRQTERCLSIFFDLLTEDILQATIRDNGIGRSASAGLKQAVAGTILHESKGMSIVEQRLQLLRNQYDKPFEAIISDITDTNGFVQGTQVILKIFIGNKK
jgi:two-component system, LytTR family, sensor kinase